MPRQNIAKELAHATVNAFATHNISIAHGVQALLKVPEVNAALKGNFYKIYKLISTCTNHT